VTGAAGFIGFHLAKQLLALDYHVIGVDNVNEYYDVLLKKDRLKILEKHPQFEFYKIDLAEREKINQLFVDKAIHIVIHLAAQAGVRYSLHAPHFLCSFQPCRVYGDFRGLQAPQGKALDLCIF